MPCPVLTGFNAIFGIACDVRSHYNFSLLLCTLTRKLHTTKLLLFSPVIPFWLISGRSHQGAPLEASRWLMSHLRHLHQHKAHLKIPWLLEIHTWSGLCLQGLAAARCCFITWNCWVFLSTDYSMQLVFTVSQKKITGAVQGALFNSLNSLYHKVLLQKVLEHKRPTDMTPWNNQSPSKVFLFF